MTDATRAFDVEVDAGIARRLIEDQHPDLSDRPLTAIGGGWDYTLFRIGDDLLLRAPRRSMAAELVVNEQRWLPVLAPQLPLPVPVPLRLGRPTDYYPWSWSIVPWFEGESGEQVAIADSDLVANQLGGFLRALHLPAPDEAPVNPYRGGPLVDRAPSVAQRVRELADEIDAAAVSRVFDLALAAPRWAGPPSWIHGDLHPANFVFAANGIAAVIDFGDLCAGDPATDVAVAWALLPQDAFGSFVAAYGEIDTTLEARARGWAVYCGLALLEIGLDPRPVSGRPAYEPIGRRTLARATADGP